MCREMSQLILAEGEIPSRQEPAMHPEFAPRLVAAHIEELARSVRANRSADASQRRRIEILALWKRYFNRGPQADQQPLRRTQFRARRARAVVRRGECGAAGLGPARR